MEKYTKEKIENTEKKDCEMKKYLKVGKDRLYYLIPKEEYFFLRKK